MIPDAKQKKAKNMKKSPYLLGAFTALLVAGSAFAQNSGIPNNTPGGSAGINGTPTPVEVQAMVRQFQQDRDRFVTQRRELQQQLATATDLQRLQIRDQLRDQLDQFKRDQTRTRDQLKDQADRLCDQLRDHTRLMDPVSKPATASGGSGQAAGARGR